ncbi:MAG: PaREP1 family protein [Thermoproteaceae archaeon]|nr:PaREP1 family protein [Thermoproteaceae archaeon]
MAAGAAARMTAEAHVKLARRYFEEGRALADRNPVQASEKLYKAAEEAVKALAVRFQLAEVLKQAGERGRWTVTDLERAVSQIARRLGPWARASWDAANYLHVWGFHEARLDADAVRERLADVERLVGEAERAVRGAGGRHDR